MRITSAFPFSPIMPSVLDTYPQVQVTSRAQWRSWLLSNHSTTKGIWLVRYKKAHGEKHVPYADVVEEALCFGWVDGLARALDDTRSQILLTPRKPRSNWSAVNKARVESLIASGLMMVAGLEKIDIAKANGSWSNLEQSDALTEPDDLKAAFTKSATARKNWDAFPPSARKATLEWIYSAKRQETRADRVKKAVELSAQNLRPR